MRDLAIEASDRPLRPDQYVYVDTHAWWMGTFGQHTHLTEHRVRQWIPARTDGEWLLDRELTGAQQWLIGSAEEAGRRRVRAARRRPDRAVRRPLRALRTRRRPRRLGDPDPRCAPTPPRRGNWQAPTPGFFADLPRDPDALREPAGAREPRQLVRAVRGRGERAAHGAGARSTAAGPVRRAARPARRHPRRRRPRRRRAGVHRASSTTRAAPAPSCWSPGGRPVRRRARHPAHRLPVRPRRRHGDQHHRRQDVPGGRVRRRAGATDPSVTPGRGAVPRRIRSRADLAGSAPVFLGDDDAIRSRRSSACPPAVPPRSGSQPVRHQRVARRGDVPALPRRPRDRRPGLARVLRRLPPGGRARGDGRRRGTCRRRVHQRRRSRHRPGPPSPQATAPKRRDADGRGAEGAARAEAGRAARPPRHTVGAQRREAGRRGRIAGRQAGRGELRRHGHPAARCRERGRQEHERLADGAHRHQRARGAGQAAGRQPRSSSTTSSSAPAAARSPSPTSSASPW